MIKIDLKRHRKEIIGSVVVLLILLGGMSVFKYTSFNSGFEIVDDLGGNIFPSAILSVATTDAQVIVPSDSTSLGNPKSCIAVRLKSKTAYSRVRIEVAETPFFSRSVSEFVLNKPRTEKCGAGRTGKRSHHSRDERKRFGTTGAYFFST